MARRLARSIPRPRYAAASRSRVRILTGTRARAKAVLMSTFDRRRPAASPMVARTGFRRQQNAHIFSAVALAVVLVLTLGFSWRDGTAGGDGVNSETPALAYSASGNATGGDLHSQMPFLVGTGSKIGPPHTPIPTARALPRRTPALHGARAIQGVC